MNTSTALKTDHKQTLNDMLVTKNILLDSIYENDGEVNDQQEESLKLLENNLPVKVDGWAWTLMKNGAIDKEIELWQQRKDFMNEIIKTLKNGKDRLKLRAHQIMLMNNLDRLDGTQFWIKRDISRAKSLMMDVVEDEYKKYELPVLSNNQYKLLLNMVKHFNGTLRNDLPFDSIYTAVELEEMIEKQKTEKCNVTNLPDGHCAIVIEERPTVRIYPKK